MSRDTAPRPLVTILDDEPEIRSMLSDTLEEAGFDTLSFGRARAFEAALANHTPDVCLVDLSLPDTDGLTLVHRLGLELGADDYIIKPFDPAEVVARIRARLRSAKPTPQAGTTARFNGWTAHFDRYVLQDATGTEVTFSHAEGEVLRLFLDAPKRLISRAQMQESLGGVASESFDRAMDVRISRLRTKLGEDPKNPQLIKTIYGAGYIFLGDVNWD